MNKEEKEAYDNLIMLKYFTMEKEDKQSIDIILKLIDKLQKEVEEKQIIIYAGAEKVKQLQKENEELKEMRYLDNELFKSIVAVEKNYISKDKIRDKIKEIEEEYSEIIASNSELEYKNINSQRYNAMKVILEELLKEE